MIMEIFNRTPISFDCDGCKKAFTLDVPLGAKVLDMTARIMKFHREQSPACPRDFAVLTAQRSYNDEFNPKKMTPHFRMGWRDVDELDLTKEERRTPMIVIG